VSTQNDEPKVSIFGSNIESNEWGYHASERVIWGFFLIFAGVIFLLNTFDYLPWDIWREIARFWPFLVILAGFQIALGNNLVARIILATIAFVFFSIVLLSILRGPFPGLFESLPAQLQNIVETISRNPRSR
jgi:hypothetical protein